MYKALERDCSNLMKGVPTGSRMCVKTSVCKLVIPVFLVDGKRAWLTLVITFRSPLERLRYKKYTLAMYCSVVTGGGD